MISQSSSSSKIISMINIIEDVFVIVTMIVISVLQLLMNFNNVSCESNKAITLKQSIREEPSTTNNNIEQRSNFLMIEYPKILMIEYSTYPDNDEGTYNYDITLPKEKEVSGIQTSKDVLDFFDGKINVVSSLENHFVRKCTIDSSASIDSLPTTCTHHISVDSSDYCSGYFSDDSSYIGDNSVSSNDQPLKILHCLEIEEPVCINVNACLENLSKREEEYNEYRLFLTLLQTNF